MNTKISEIKSIEETYKIVKEEFDKLAKNKYFKNILKKITLEEKLDYDELSYILVLSIIFYDWYKKTEKEYYFEFSYYLTLKYTLITLDTRPLYDFSVNNGLYPITKLIFTKYMTEFRIFDIMMEVALDEYKFNERIELKEQVEIKQNILLSENKYKSFIAPTSYGKSELIIDDIIVNNYNKIGVIVPKKALIWENFRRLKIIAKKRKYKIMMHDSEYNNEERFIGIFTQERAIRLIQENNVYFDIMYIDEAHNLFEGNERNILLTRLIRLNQKYKPDHNVLFLSPLIQNSNNLAIDKKINIDEFRITFNIKEPDIYYYDGNKVKKYNRFINCYFEDKYNYTDWIEYVKSQATNKALFYLYRPKHVQDFAMLFSKYIEEIKNEEINKIVMVLGKYVDENYYLIDLIKKGIIYIHGIMPDSIRDYIIEKYKKTESIKYLISNTSILEGVNLPISSLFIVYADRLQKNDLNNLIGRVNRLNKIFIDDPSLDKLLVPVHFVQTSINWNNKLQNFESKIKLLRTLQFEDKVVNPVLLKTTKEDLVRVERENLIIQKNSSYDVEMILLKNNVDYIYHDFSQAKEIIAENIVFLREIPIEKNINTIIDLISFVFTKNFRLPHFKDHEIGRLVHQEAIDFYKRYYPQNYFTDLKFKIGYFMRIFKGYGEQAYYIGKAFGEVDRNSNVYAESNKKVYINVKNKTDKELKNLAIIKAQIEDDFIGFKLAKLVKSLCDLEIIDKELYDEFLYNTRDKNELKLLKSGLSWPAIKFIKDNDLEKDFIISDNEVKTTEKFNKLLKLQDDFIQFEFSKIMI